MTYVRKLIKNYGTISVTTSPQPQAQVVIPNFGDLVALDLELAMAITIGTGAVATGNALMAMRSITFRDKRQQIIHDCPQPSLDVQATAFILSANIDAPQVRGEYVTLSNITSSGGSAQMKIPVRINTSDQPATVDWTLGVLSDFLGTVGTATSTVTFQLWGIWHDPNTKADGTPALLTLRTIVAPKTGLGTGDNYIDLTPYTGLLVNDLMIYYASDSNLNNITFTPDGSIAIDSAYLQHFINYENGVLEKGHQVGLVWLDMDSFYPSSKSKLDVNLLVSTPIRLYLLLTRPLG